MIERAITIVGFIMGAAIPIAIMGMFLIGGLAIGYYAGEQLRHEIITHHQSCSTQPATEC